MSSHQPANKQAAAEGVTIGDDFIVHSKHTCDKCYTRPIVGKRYTSGVVSDFDLCEKCFKEYDGPEMAFSETLLARDKATKNNFVLKLKIESGVEDAQIRRINVAELWDPSVSVLSFNKLMSIASRFTAADGGEGSVVTKFDASKARATYIDEDGDKITISSNEELMDSFVQTVKKQPFRPFRVTVRVGVDVPPQIYVSMSGPCAKVYPPHGGPFGRARHAARRGRFRGHDAAVTEAMNSPADAPSLGHTSMPVADEDGVMAARGLGSDKSSETPKSDETPAAEKPPLERCASSLSFIHARHTCDGCSKTPIIGTRYHATKIPDFDLCEACFAKYEGEDLDFIPEALDIDCRMQSRWLKRQFAKSAKATKGIVDLMKMLEAGAKVAVASRTVESRSPEADIPKEGDKRKSSEKIVDGQETAAVEPEGKKTKPSQEEKYDIPGYASFANVVESTVQPEVKESNLSPDRRSDEKKSDSSASRSANSKGNDDSFLSDAEGHGSIAEVIGRTLDICVQAMEEVMAEKNEQIKNIDTKSTVEKDVAAIVSAAVDTYSVASSVVSSVTDILKKMEESKSCAGGTVVSGIPADVPSTVSGATILKSVDDQDAVSIGDEVHLEDASVGDDGWSVVDDNKEEEKDEFSGAAEMIGSFLYNSGVMSAAEKGFDEKGDSIVPGESKEPLSPVVLAKWDAELKTLHELGFLDERKNVDTLEHLEAVKRLKASAESRNINVDGVSYSSDVIEIHNLLKQHKLIYNANVSPDGKWSWGGLREIKKKGNDSNPNFVLPDGIATFYGNLNYEYRVRYDSGVKNTIHDVVAISSILLDAQARPAPKSGNTGVYGVDWWNIYVPLPLLKKLTDNIRTTTGYIVGDEGVIMDPSQGLASITINIRNIEDSPDITMITVVKDEEGNEGDLQAIDDDAENVRVAGRRLQYNSMGTLAEIMGEGGETDLIGGVGFFSVGISCKGHAGSAPPAAGTTVKLSLKMKAFHALHIIESGIRRINYKSKSAGLKY